MSAPTTPGAGLVSEIQPEAFVLIALLCKFSVPFFLTINCSIRVCAKNLSVVPRR